MKHPEVLLLPIMMFADYFLTVLGAIKREKGYNQHFKTQHYELNPIFQKHVAEKRWVNPRHAVVAIVASGAMIFLMECGSLPESLASGALGCVLVLYGAVLGRHGSNLLIFAHLSRKPEWVSGTVTMSHEFVLVISLYQILMGVLPIVIIAVFAPSYFACGGVVGILLWMNVHLQWMRKARKRESVCGESEAAAEESEA